MSAATKVCASCGEPLPIGDFSVRRAAPDGRNRNCRRCANAKMRAWKISKGRPVREDLPEGSKRCTVCNEVKPVEQFYRKLSGRQGQCRDCNRRARGVLHPRIDPSIPDNMKRCPACDEVLPLDAFHASKRGPKGRAVYCKQCSRIKRTGSLERTAPRTYFPCCGSRTHIRRDAHPRHSRVCPDCDCVWVVSVLDDELVWERGDPDVRICGGCGTELPLDEYWMVGNGCWCKTCERAKTGAVPAPEDPAPPDSKTCAGCGLVKLLSGYYEHPQGRRATQSRCKTCVIAAEKAKRRRQGIPARPVYDDPPGEKTCRRCKVRKSASDFGSAPRNTTDGLTSFCRDCQNLNTAKYRRENPDVTRAIEMRRRARRRKAGVFRITQRDLRRMLARYKECLYCGGSLVQGQVDWDHLVPLARGGRHSIGNLHPVCATCNRSKGSKVRVEFLNKRKTSRVRPP